MIHGNPRMSQNHGVNQVFYGRYHMRDILVVSVNQINYFSIT
jgi:hypothetical protein